MLKYLTTKRGKRQLVDGNFSYYIEREEPNFIRWKCSNYYKCNCRARCITVEGKITVKSGIHNHVADAAAIEVKEILCNINEEALRNRDTPRFVIGNNVSNCSQSAKARLPMSASISRTIRRRRKVANREPSLPQHRRDIVIPEDFKVTNDGNNFLLFDSGPTDNRILVFGSIKNLELLAASNVWLADGTFKHVPLLFYQLYTLHALVRGITVPLIYALLPDKSEDTYRSLLQALLEKEPGLNPSTIITDFEKAAMKAFTSVFPQVNQHGCFFHFSQALFRHIQSQGLQRRYESDSEFALKMRFLPALAFVPENEVIQAFDTLIDEEILPDEANDIISYFEDTWIGRPTRQGRRRNPLFPITIWNCYNSVLQDLPRTNNNVEAWHRGFEALTYGHHENIWRTINNLQKSQALTEIAIEQNLAGQPPPTKKRKYVNLDHRLKRILSTYSSSGCIDYLRAVAHNLSF